MQNSRVLLGRSALLACLAIPAVPATAFPVQNGQNAQTPATPASTAPQSDEAEPVPAEPDFRLVNLPTTLWLPAKGMNFGLTHRFGGNLRSGGFTHQLENLFGLDQGALIGLEFRYGIARHVQAIVFRTNLDKTVQFTGKWDALRQNAARPVSLSVMVGVEGLNNFRDRYQPEFAAIVSHQMKDRLAVYATPIFVHNSAISAGRDDSTFALGLGGKARIAVSTYVVAEITPRLGGYTPGDAEYGFGIEKRVGGHSFQLNFSNTLGTTLAQTARGGQGQTLYMGFNLARKYY